MRIFAGERMKSLLLTLGMEEGVPIEGRMISASRIESPRRRRSKRRTSSRASTCSSTTT